MDWMAFFADWRTDSLIDMLSNWLIYQPADELTDWLTDWLPEQVLYWLTGYLTDGLTNQQSNSY